MEGIGENKAMERVGAEGKQSCFGDDEVSSELGPGNTFLPLSLGGSGPSSVDW